MDNNKSEIAALNEEELDGVAGGSGSGDVEVLSDNLIFTVNSNRVTKSCDFWAEMFTFFVYPECKQILVVHQKIPKTTDLIKNRWFFLARDKGFEPLTFWSVDRVFSFYDFS